MVATTQDMVSKTHDMAETTNELRDHIADFDDFFRPLRNYLYWEPHCVNIPVCYSVRSLFDTLDGIDAVTDQLAGLVSNLDQLTVILPQTLAQFPVMNLT